MKTATTQHQRTNRKPTRKAATKRRSAQRDTDVRRSDWRSALIGDEQYTHNVSLRAMTNDSSTNAGMAGSNQTKLWEVNVEIEHRQNARSVYYEPKTPPKYASPNDSAFVTITVSCPRGQIGLGREVGNAEPVTTTIKCELGHIDALVLALANALIIGRRDGTFPVVRGMKSFSAELLANMRGE